MLWGLVVLWWWLWVGAVFVWSLLNMFRVDQVGWINNVAAFVQFASVFVIIIVILVKAPSLASGSFVFTEYYNTTGKDDKSYVGAIGLLGVLFSFSGFEASAHMAEETHGARKSASSGIIRTCFATGLCGFGYILALLFCTTNLDALMSTCHDGEVRTLPVPLVCCWSRCRHRDVLSTRSHGNASSCSSLLVQLEVVVTVTVTRCSRNDVSACCCCWLSRLLLLLLLCCCCCCCYCIAVCGTDNSITGVAAIDVFMYSTGVPLPAVTSDDYYTAGSTTGSTSGSTTGSTTGSTSGSTTGSSYYYYTPPTPDYAPMAPAGVGLAFLIVLNLWYVDLGGGAPVVACLHTLVHRPALNVSQESA